MKITDKMLNIPPYLSTPWKEISSLHTRIDAFGRPLLAVALRHGMIVEVPELNDRQIEEVFEGFSKYTEKEGNGSKFLFDPIQFSLPLKKGMPIDSFNLAMQHDPEKANTPNLPAEMLSKISVLAKTLGLEDASVLPKPEPHCNCIHCQVVRSLQNGSADPEEEVSEEELAFRTWDVQKSGDKLYTVTNPLDSAEQYTVFLGEPLGCNCGEKKCEHIRAVLNT